MLPEALAPYESALRDTAELGLMGEGFNLSLDVAKWLAPVDSADRVVLARCAGPVLDVGCGPGRFVRALGELGLPALGVDIADTAVQLTRSRGVAALERDIFSDVPGEGRWGTVLLMDGNIGIGGDVPRLLGRLSEVLQHNGLLIVEADTEPELDEICWVRFAVAGRPIGPEFQWARIGRDRLIALAGRHGFAPDGTFYADGRCFVCLRERATAIR